MILGLRTEKPTQQRHPAQSGNAGHLLACLPIDQSGKHLCLIVAGGKRGFRRTRTQVVGDEPGLRLHLPGDVAHIQRDLDHDFVVQTDAGLHVELQTDVLICQRFRDRAVQVGRTHDGYAFANADRRFLAIAHPNARVGKDLRLVRLLQQIQACQRRRNVEIDGVAAQSPEPAQRDAAAGVPDSVGEAQRHALRITDAEIEQTIVGDFEHLHVERHLGGRQIDHVDHAGDRVECLGTVAHRDRAQTLVHEQVARAHELPDLRGGLLDVGIAEEECLHRERPVPGELLGGRRENEQCVGIEKLLFQTVCREQQIDDVPGGGLCRVEARACCTIEVAVEHEVDPRDLRNHLENRGQRTRFDTERDRLAQHGGGRRRCGRRCAVEDASNPLRQRDGFPPVGQLAQHARHDAQRRARIARCPGLRIGQRSSKAVANPQPVEPLCRRLIGGVEAQRLRQPVPGLRFVAARKGVARVAQVLRRELLAYEQIACSQSDALRVVAQVFGKPRDGAGEISLADGRVALGQRIRHGAAPERRKQAEHAESRE